jgi:hypothetical protein
MAGQLMARQVGGNGGRPDKKPPRAHKKPPRAHKSRPEAARRPRKADNPPGMTEPPCAECGLPSRLTTGATIYPHRRDLHGLNFWQCPRCDGSYVGCHKGGDGRQALGRPAGAYLRKARGQVHKMLDPLWERAETMLCYHPFTGNAWNVRSSQRVRVYAYLRVKLGLQEHEAHIGWFDLEQCRSAWRLLQHMRPDNIRDWWKAGGEDEFKALQEKADDQA